MTVRIRGYRKRVIQLTCRNNEELLELADRIKERITYVNFRLNYKSGNIKITLYGPDEIVREAVREIYEIYRDLRGELYPDVEGLYRYSIKEIIHGSNMIAIPLNLLAKALEAKGYKAKIEGGYIRTNAKLCEVKDLALTISETYNQLRYLRMTPTCKRLVALYVAVKDTSIDDAIADLEDMKLIRMIKDMDGREKYILAKEFNQAVELILCRKSGD